MPTLADRFTAMIKRLRPPQSQTTTSDFTRRRRSLYGEIMTDTSRRAMVEYARQMYDTDPRVEEVINTLARGVAKGGFTVTVKSAQNPRQVEELMVDTLKRLHVFKRLDDWCRLSFIDGDSLLELGVDAAGLIQEVTRKPTLLTHRNSNDRDKFSDPARAYWYHYRPWVGGQPPADAVWFADWQIIHARWNHNEGSRYGRPLYASARTAFKNLTEGEENVSIRRKTRSGMRYLHKLNTNDPNEVAAYMENNKDTLDNPYAPIQDFFGNVDVDAVQGDATLGEIRDVVHHLDTLGAASPVPLELIGYGRDLNRDILEDKREQYLESLESVTEWAEDQIIKPLLEMQMLLAGIWPEAVDYEIVWAPKKTLTPAMLNSVAEAGLKLRSLGWPDDIIVDVLAPMLPGVDIEAVKQAMAAAAARMPDEIDRIAAMAAQRMGQTDAQPAVT